MTEKHKDRTINSIISFIIAVGVVFIGADLTSDAAEKKALQDAIKCKANIDYVDKRNSKQDELINANSNKIDENYNRIDKKIDKIYDYIISIKSESK